MFEESTYRQLPDHFYASLVPEPVSSPTLIAWNAPLAADLGLDGLEADRTGLARLLSGGDRPNGQDPIALAYAGHQFGQFVPQLGDGRAALIGEAIDRQGRRYDIQLKGSGRTPFSRGGDGRSAMGPVLREYIVSEAMHHLGIPTTRALAAVATGDYVYREDRLPGAVLTRVASSHLRVGTFEYFASRGDRQSVRQLADYAISRHYPEIGEDGSPYVALLDAVADRQAALVARWMSVGFIHGVMNTDNFSIAGETIDYGPCAFMDEFLHDKVFSSIDRYGRYAYSNQAPIAQWNLARLAECLLFVCDERERFEDIVQSFLGRYDDRYIALMRAKLGLSTSGDADASLIRDWLDHLEANGLDYTLSFRQLAERADANDDQRFGDIEVRWRRRFEQEGASARDVRDSMDAVNPLFIPRNHRIEEAIRAGISGDLSIFSDLNEVLTKPFEPQPAFARYAEAPEPAERIQRTFCGT